MDSVRFIKKNGMIYLNVTDYIEVLKTEIKEWNKIVTVDGTRAAHRAVGAIAALEMLIEQLKGIKK